MSIQEPPSRALDTQLPQVIIDLLKKRGLEDESDINHFLNPDYIKDLGDPFLMADMDKLVTRLLAAIKHNQYVAIYGDYDIDGVVSTALMMEILQQYGVKCRYYIPDRYEEGYGLNIDALKSLKEDGVDLVVTVDCGITSVMEVEWANENKLDIVITDHHEVPEATEGGDSSLPSAIAVVNPKRQDCHYPFKELAGVGVVFAVARALQSKLHVPANGHEKWFLDLVALGTVCDVMPLVGENRALVHFGLLVLRKTKRLGLVALAQAAGITLHDLRPYHLGFVFGPRMNAAGRLKHAATSLSLITTNDPVDAQKLAYQLEELNHKRQVEQARVVAEANAAAEAYTDNAILLLADESWPHGIVGIVASKLAEKWRKPTMIFQLLDDTAKGSGRSANGYDLIAGLRASGNLFDKLGGHQFAAGCTLPVVNLDHLRINLEHHYRLIEPELTPAKSFREAEVFLDDASLINWDLYNAIQMLEPFGNGNPQPVFGVNDLKIVDVGHAGKAKDHLRLRLAAGSGAVFEAMGFGLASKYDNLRTGQVVDLTFFLEKNQFNNKTSLQLVVLAIQ